MKISHYHDTVIYLIFSIIGIFLVSCHIETDSYHESFFDATNAVPLTCDIEIENSTAEDITLESSFYEVGGRDKIKKIISSNTDCIVSGGKISKTDIAVMNKDISYNISYCRVDGDGSNRVIVSGFSTFALYQQDGTERTLLWNGAEEKGNYKEYDDNLINAKDFKDLGGNLYFVLDWDKDGTESFGELVSSVSGLNGIESGHIKIRLTITEGAGGKKVCTLSKIDG